MISSMWWTKWIYITEGSIEDLCHSEDFLTTLVSWVQACSEYTKAISEEPMEIIKNRA